MPNKPHPPRNKGSKAGASATTINGEDTSFIVFGDGKKKKGGGTNNTNSSARASASTNSPAADNPSKDKKPRGVGTPRDGPATATAAADEATKKPDTRTLVAGASWTGKLPLTLLNEHCQKQKWEKPEYVTHRCGGSAGGFVGSVVLRCKNGKTGETTTLPAVQLPRERQHLVARETAVEARHAAACWALFRVASGKNLGMALPPAYRDLWKGEFQEVKRADVEAGRGWWYEGDPFAAKRAEEERREGREKERRDREESRAREEKERGEREGLGGKGWGRAPKVDMGRRMRKEVEALVRRGTRWNAHGLDMGEAEKRRVVDEVAAMGFRRAHVVEAADKCKDRQEVLEWLIIHVPEDDLPKWCLPENYAAGVSMASGDMARENKIKRLSVAGYAADLCSDILRTCENENEALAAEKLQRQLLGAESPPTLNAQDTSADDSFWKEEMYVLESIYGDKIQKDGSDIYRIALEIAGEKQEPATLLIRCPPSGYPARPPIVAIEAALPSYIRLSITKRALQEGIADLTGEQMVYALVDWLEQNIPNIIQDPGSLKTIAAAVGLPAEDSNATRNTATKRQRRNLPMRSHVGDGSALLSAWQARQSTPEQQKMNAARQKLPAWQLRHLIVESVNSNQVTIISGETGSGKSTQSVQFILDDMIQRGLGAGANIICTQPRRISALGLADRVSDERCSTVGREVGYSIRGESRQQLGVTKITFVTTGVLLRRLQTSGADVQGIAASLADISHVVMDEVHERSLDTDFLMALLRDVLQIRKDLKLILMSATLDAALFENYFASSASVAKVQIAGRTHPVAEVYLEDVLRVTGYASQTQSNPDDDEDADGANSMGQAIRSVGTRINYDLIAMVVDYIDQSLTGNGDKGQGAILIFLPGVAEIDRTLAAVRHLGSKFQALPLHASLQPADQRKVFPRATAGSRKVIAATNVAETSITIEDVVAVIDTGKVKETSFDPIAGMVRLAEVWASKAACKQRQGRAGRVTAGTCYKLYSRNLEATKMAERPEPEIKRVPLEQLCLSVKAMGLRDVKAFLGKAISPPDTRAVDTALSTLGKMGVLDGDALTALGHHLAMIPADLRCAKLLVVGATFGCLESCLTIASLLSVKSPFVSPQDKREEAKSARLNFSDGSGDLICDLAACQQWQEKRNAGEPAHAVRAWCGANFLSTQTLQDIAKNRSQYLEILKDIQFVPHDYSSESTKHQYLNRHAGNKVLLRALIAASFTPQIARIEFPDLKYIASVSGSLALDPEAHSIKFYTRNADDTRPGNERTFLHPSSTLFTAQSYPTNTAFMSYFTKMATSKVFMRDITPCNAYSLLLFCGTLKVAPQKGGGILVDEWIRIRGWARIGVLVSRLRAMLDEVLEKKLDAPDLAVSDDKVVKLVRKLIELDGMDN